MSTESIQNPPAEPLTGDADSRQDKEKRALWTTTQDSSCNVTSNDVTSNDVTSNDESAILKRQTETPDTTVGIMALYRYASTTDMCIIAVSCIMSIASGVTMPLMVVVFGNLQSTLQDFFHGNVAEEFAQQLSHVVLYFVYLAIGGFIATYTYTVGFICKFRRREVHTNTSLNEADTY
jgi:hypothetical protein